MKNKRHSWRTIQWSPFTYLTSGSLNQGFICEQEGGSGGVEQDKGLSDTLGAKILSEKKEARENKFVSLVGRTSALVHWLAYFQACFSVFSKVWENWKIKTAKDLFSISFTIWKLKIVFDFYLKIVTKQVFCLRKQKIVFENIKLRKKTVTKHTISYCFFYCQKYIYLKLKNGVKIVNWQK